MRLESTITRNDTHGFAASDAVDLLDWKHTIFDLYAFIRHSPDPKAAWERWRGVRDRLYADHPQSPIPADAREAFDGCPFYDYDPAFRTIGQIEDREPERRGISVSTGETFAFTRIGVARFELAGAEHELELSWNEGYGGGIFLAFTDETSGSTTYGGGRYLIDTVKGADLGSDAARGTMVLDFNFAYNPSCAYDPAWACPLAQPGNVLPIALPVGELYG
jgi:uncharacterized protein (DUF1684 family)